MPVVHKELDRSGVHIADRLHGADRVLRHFGAGPRVEGGRRAFFQQFLVLALDGALALAEDHRVPLPVAEHLHLDMLGRVEVFFKIDGAVPERQARLRRGDGERAGELLWRPDQPDAASAAPASGFYQQGEADLFRLRPGLLHVFDPFAAGNHRDAGGPHGAAGHVLVAHAGEHARRRADEDDFALLAQGRELRVLRKEPVPRVDGAGAGRLGRRDDRRDVQVAVLGLRGADAHAFVRKAHGQGIPVRFRKHRDRGDAHLFARAYDADRNLPAVGNQDF